MLISESISCGIISNIAGLTFIIHPENKAPYKQRKLDPDIQAQAQAQTMLNPKPDAQKIKSYITSLISNLIISTNLIDLYVVILAFNGDFPRPPDTQLDIKWHLRLGLRTLEARVNLIRRKFECM